MRMGKSMVEDDKGDAQKDPTVVLAHIRCNREIRVDSQPYMKRGLMFWVWLKAMKKLPGYRFNSDTKRTYVSETAREVLNQLMCRIHEITPAQLVWRVV